MGATVTKSNPSSETSMRCWKLHEHGGVDQLSMTETTKPQVTSSGQVLVQIEACGINHLDLWVRKGVAGHHFALPLTVGSDASGIIVDAPSEYGDQIGRRVLIAPATSCGHCAHCLSGADHYCADYRIFGEDQNGFAAEYAVVPIENIVRIPDNLSFEEAACIGIPFLTAWEMLVRRAQLKASEWVWVQGGTSGVGMAAIQIARFLNARVIAGARTEEKRQLCVQLGAEDVVDPGAEDVVKEVRERTKGGAHVVFEHIGAATWEQSTRALRAQGRYVSCGATTGPKVTLNLNHLFFKSLSFLGSTMGRRSDLQAVVHLFERGLLKPVPYRSWNFSQLPLLHEALEVGGNIGKCVLKID